jgi:hypothetical protein
MMLQFQLIATSWRLNNAVSVLCYFSAEKARAKKRKANDKNDYNGNIHHITDSLQVLLQYGSSEIHIQRLFYRKAVTEGFRRLLWDPLSRAPKSNRYSWGNDVWEIVWEHNRRAGSVLVFIVAAAMVHTPSLGADFRLTRLPQLERQKSRKWRDRVMYGGSYACESGAIHLCLWVAGSTCPIISLSRTPKSNPYSW